MATHTDASSSCTPNRAGAGPGAVVQVDTCSRRRARRARGVGERHSKRCRTATNRHGPTRPDVEKVALDAPAENAADARVKLPQCMMCRNDHEARTRCYEAHLFSVSHFREPRGLKPDLRRNAVRVSQPLGEFVQLLAECASQPPAAAIRDAAAPFPHFTLGQPERLVP